LETRGQPLAQVICLTLKNVGAPGPLPARAALQEKLDEAIILVSDKMYDRLNLMSTIYTLGPLLGLIGTILGLMDTFTLMARWSNPPVQMLAVGVQKALVTTLWGLSMAIPASRPASGCRRKIRIYEREVFPRSVWRVIELIKGDAKSRLPETWAPVWRPPSRSWSWSPRHEHQGSSAAADADAAGV